MKPIRLITIVGARPQFIKAAALSSAISKNVFFEEIIVHTGQHFDMEMSDIFFKELGIPRPSYNLKIGGGTHGENTGKMIIEIERVLIAESPDAVILFGDTDSTLAGAIASGKLHIPIIHIEAGLRSFNMRMPEEINRVMTDRISSILFAPSTRAKDQLIREGSSLDKICVCGDIMFDATLRFRTIAESQVSERLKLLIKENAKYGLLTLHRAENVDNRSRLENLLKCIELVDHTILFPVHPRTKNRLNEFNLMLPPNVIELEPVGYLSMLFMQKHASIIMTDSGGIQKEAFFNKVPCLTLRRETEWVELVDLGVNFIVSDNQEKFVAALRKSDSINEAIYSEDVYGNGSSAEQILEFVKLNLNVRP